MNLADWLKKSHSAPEQVNVVEAVCDALHQAHVSGALRGEIGPGAIEVQGGRSEIAQAGGPVPQAYRAPESQSGGGSGPAAAVFSAGVILYEILAGRNPFPGGSPTAQPEPLRNLRRDLPSELTDAVMACLESDPDWRPKDLSYVLQVLKRLRGNTPVATPAPAPARAASRPIVVERSARPEPVRARKQPASARRGGPPLFAIAIGASVLIGAGVYYWLSQSGGKKNLAALPPSTTTPAAVASPSPAATATLGRAQAPPTPLATITPAPATPAPTIAPAMPLATAAPVLPVATPTPLPTRVVVATPLPTVPPTAPPTPQPTAPPTVAPTRPPTPPPTPAPTAAPAAVSAASAALAALKSIAPPNMPRGTTNFYDLHGTGLQTGLSAVIMKGRDVAAGIAVTKQVVVSPTLMRVVVRVDPAAAPGAYGLVLVDSRGQATNSVSVKIP